MTNTSHAGESPSVPSDRTAVAPDPAAGACGSSRLASGSSPGSLRDPASRLASGSTPGSLTPAPVREGLLTLAFGAVSAIGFLSLLAAVPVVQLVSLGWLLEAEGRIARTGTLRGALPGLAGFARAGGVALGILLAFLPYLILADLAHDARLIDPGSSQAGAMASWARVALVVGSAHSLLAVARARSFWAFVRPIANLRHAVAHARPSAVAGGLRGAWDWAASVPADRFFLLGLRGFLAALAWIALPTALLALGLRAPGPAVLGGFLLALAVVPLPLLQARLAAEGRFRAGFELGAVWDRSRRAPIASLLALLLTLGLALPLYLLKIELIPRDARGLAAAVFLLTILPTKLVAGWAYARGGRPGRAPWPLRGVVALLALPVAGFYVLVVALARFVDWNGAASLFEQHAFLVPTAFY